MRKIIKLAGVAVSGGTNLPKVTRTAADIAMAHVPGWKMLLDPDYVTSGAPRNLAQPDQHCTVASGTITLGSFANGATAFDTLTSGEINVQPQVAWNANEWSLFQVIRAKTPASGSSAYAFAYNADGGSGDFSPRMGFNAGAVRASIYEGDATLRLGYTPGTAYLDRLALLMYTFSTRDGLKIYEDGVLVASDAAASEPLTTGYASGEWSVMFDSQALIGMTGLLDIDLGKTEYAHHRTAISDFLINKYGI